MPDARQKLEPEAYNNATVASEHTCLASIAISLKRIADQTVALQFLPETIQTAIQTGIWNAMPTGKSR